MHLGFPSKEIIEGKARILVPKLDLESGQPIQHLRSEAPVFYNPVMKTNRDSAVLALKAIQAKKRMEMNICEPMCGSGVRGIRFSREVKNISNVTMGDLNPKALKLAQENVKINEVIHKINLRLLDANLLLSLHAFPGGRFDYVDIDPYGSPSPYIHNGVLSVKNHGIIALTATDMAPLCGVNKKACIRKYGGVPIQSEFCHEIALRLLTSLLIKIAAINEISAKPLFSYYSDHYIRLYAKLDKGARRADEKILKIGYIKYCSNCLHRKTSIDNKKEKCPLCKNIFEIAGPLWLGELSNREFTEKMKEELSLNDYLYDSRINEILKKGIEEIGYPVGYFNIDKVCSLIGIKSIPTQVAIDRITENGYNVTLTHFDNRGIKTNASIVELKKIFSV
jgi:tRNA (guanine26-N2/guanine27-N2)-dimethyltransferase